MDAGRGIICRGPEGPHPDLSNWDPRDVDVPSSVDFLKEDVFLRFLASYKSKTVDYIFVRGMMQHCIIGNASEMWNQPTVISTLTQTPIALANSFISEPEFFRNLPKEVFWKMD